MQLHLGGTLHALSIPFAKLAFWRKAAAASGADAASPEAAETAAADTPAPKPGVLQRLKARFRRSPAAEAETPPEATPDAAASEEADAAVPRPSLFERLKTLFRRKAAPTDDAEAGANAPTASEAIEEIDPEAAPANGLLARLRSKWVWIPALVVLLLAIIGGVAALFVRNAHETERLQRELQAAKRQIEQQKTVAAVPTPAPVSAPAPLPAPATPTVETKHDPAFDIVAAKPAPEAQSGVNAGDCVVTDREQVATNLKRCIESFNAALGNPSKNKKP